MVGKKLLYLHSVNHRLFTFYGFRKLHQSTKIAGWLLYLFVGLPPAAMAQGSVQRLDSLFTALSSQSILNGNVLVAEKNQVTYKKSFGYADLQRQILNSDSSVFTIASISKTITSVTILQLLEKHRLKLDDPLRRYMPDFPFPAITIRQLLSHTSGLPDKEVLFDSLLKNQPDRIITNQDLMPALKALKKSLINQPGQKWQYSNINYNLLALLVEKLTHTPFDTYLKDHIFKPAQMNHTWLETALHKPVIANRTINYKYSTHYAPSLARADTMASSKMWLNLNGLIGQGGIVTTTQDLFRFDQSLYIGSLVKASTLQQAFTPTKLSNGQVVEIDGPVGRSSYGLGWFILADTSAGKIVWHNGSVPGGLAFFLRNITNHQTVIILDNAESFGLYTAGVNAFNILGKKPLTIRKRSLAELYAKDLWAKGADYGVCRLISLRGDSTRYYFEPGEMDQIGHELLRTNHIEFALELFKLNTLLKPDAWEVYQSYGIALQQAGKRGEAISMYEQSLRMNPKNEQAQKALAQLKAK